MHTQAGSLLIWWRHANHPVAETHRRDNDRHRRRYWSSIRATSTHRATSSLRRSARCGSRPPSTASAGGFESVRHAATRFVAQRECGRIQMDDRRVAGALYERMGPIIAQVADQVGVTHSDAAYGPVGLSGNIRLDRYGRGMSFGRHFDGSNAAPSFGDTANTEITVLIYLSDCRGGATRFYPPASSGGGTSTKKTKKKQKEAEKPTKGGVDDKDGVAFVPEQGAVLLHVHGDRCLEHEADPVLDGIKYVLRTDVVYAVDGGA